MQKERYWPQNWLLMKNLQFLSNFHETLSKDHINEIVNWTKFGQDWIKIVDFLLIANFEASTVLYASVSKKKHYFCSYQFLQIRLQHLFHVSTWFCPRNIRTIVMSTCWFFWCFIPCINDGEWDWPFFRGKRGILLKSFKTSVWFRFQFSPIVNCEKKGDLPKRNIEVE